MLTTLPIRQCPLTEILLPINCICHAEQSECHIVFTETYSLLVISDHVIIMSQSWG